MAAAFSAKRYGGATSSVGQAASGMYERALTSKGYLAACAMTMCSAGIGRSTVCGRADSEGEGGGAAMMAKKVHSRLPISSWQVYKR